MLTSSTIRLTMLAGQFAAEHNSPPRQASREELLSTYGAATEVPWPDATASLTSAAPKLLIACLSPADPMLVWPLEAVPAPHQAKCAWEFSNTAAYLQGKIEALGLDDSTLILIGLEASPIEVSLKSVRDYLSEVAFLNLGWTLRSYRDRVWLVLIGADNAMTPPVLSAVPG